MYRTQCKYLHQRAHNFKSLNLCVSECQTVPLTKTVVFFVRLVPGKTEREAKVLLGLELVFNNGNFIFELTFDRMLSSIVPKVYLTFWQSHSILPQGPISIPD